MASVQQSGRGDEAISSVIPAIRRYAWCRIPYRRPLAGARGPYGPSADGEAAGGAGADEYLLYLAFPPGLEHDVVAGVGQLGQVKLTHVHGPGHDFPVQQRPRLVFQPERNGGVRRVRKPDPRANKGWYPDFGGSPGEIASSGPP